MTDYSTDEWQRGNDDPENATNVCLVQYDSHSTYLFQGKFPKLVITFKIISGMYEGLEAHAHYNVLKHWGKNRFKVAPRGKFAKEFYGLFTDEPIHRADEFPILPFRHVTIEAKVSKVKRDSEDALPVQLQWLMVDKLLRVKA